MDAKAKDAARIRERLRQLVDQLPAGELHAAERFLQFVHEQGDPLLRRLMDAPPDDEPVTEEEEVGVREAWEDYRAGRVTPLDELERERGR